ncbi:MAG TPA: IPTL-CTERM sorting domain-containing protein [Thermoanaerobaculia bacterium]|nr:IPTL-CTERM sorting domain-containing protein [Thermoanaerobaculia bacterium]
MRGRASRRGPWRAGTAPAPRRLGISGLALALLVGLAAPAGAQVIAGRGFGESVVSFQDVNGNGVLDCLEPVTIRAAYVDPVADTATGSVTGQMMAPFAGANGLAFIPGSVELDRVFSVGDCVATIAGGNDPSDVAATVSFSCGPPRSNGPGAQGGNVVAFLYRAAFRGTVPSFTAVMRGTTSDGLDLRPQLTQSAGIGTVCPAGGGTPSVTVLKTVAGTGLPGSTLLYTISATDRSGLGLGGVQLTDEIPQNTVFDAAASSPGWVCPAGSAGSLCRLPAGNIGPDGTVTRYFAVDLAPALPAGVSAVSNTACARSGPSTVVGCGSVATPTAGTVSLTMVKSLASGTGAPGGTIVYDLRVVNSGTQDSGPVTISETVPADTSWAGGGGWSCSGAGVGSSCSLAVGNVAAGGGAAGAQFAVVVASPLPAGVTSIVNTACANAAGSPSPPGGPGGPGEPGGPGDQPSCSTATVPTTGMPLLAVHKTVAGTGAPGSNLIYSIAVQNTGNQGAANVTVSEAVPGLTTYVAAGSSPAWVCAGSAAGASCTAAIASLPAGASTVLTYVVAIASPLPAGASVVTNQACAAAPGLPSACGATSIPTTGQPSLHLAKSYGGGAVLPGAVLPFTLTVSNSGNQDVGAALLTETVPALSSFDAGASDARWLCAGVAAGSSCTLDLGGLPAGTSQAVAFAVRAAAALPAAAVIANAACVTGRDPQIEAAGRTALGTALRQLRRGARPAQVAALQACGSVETPPALAIDTTLAAAVVGHGAPALPGDRIHYILTVPNGTGATLTTLLAAASLDANTALVAGSVTTSQGAVTTGNGAGDTTVVVALGDLAAGGTATVEWDVTVHANLPPGLAQVAAQVETTGGNIPPDESGPPPPPSTPGPTETPVTAGTLPPPQAIPTLGEWGLGAMIVLLGGTAAVVMRRGRRRAAAAAADARARAAADAGSGACE